ncbi:MAG: hypothetical protein HY741_00935 [Chloroflexi bacterium]|nr:hypothetical protein [Chloroflexota bacterium]
MFQVMLEFDEEWAVNDSHRVKGNFDCEIAVSPIIALRHARAFLAGYVTLMTNVGAPVLVLGDRPRWRIPAYFVYPQLGEVSTLGAVEIDAQTGEVTLATAHQISAMKERANAIATRLAPQPVAAG